MNAKEYIAELFRFGQITVPQIPIRFIVLRADNTVSAEDSFEAICSAIPRVGEIINTPSQKGCVVIGVSYEFTEEVEGLHHMTQAIISLRE